MGIDRHLPFRPRHGFTLIELVVVVFLLGLMVFIAVPRFQEGLPADSTRRSILRLIQTVESLKKAAVQRQSDHTLHLNMDTHQLWITTESMPEEARLMARQDATGWTGALKLEKIRFPGEDREVAGEVALHFYKKGYSDRARIFLRREGGRRATLVIEPFLFTVRIENGHVPFRE